ncbi:MAG: transglycosylase domain-containing protein [Candidatus Spechtbacteria bacterium]|nr:transglycosylase domain-containing protein [Candidatus Spechtbacteria bacterium]
MTGLLKKLRTILLYFIALIMGLFLVGGGVVAYYVKTLPSPQDLTNMRVVESTKIYDRTGTVLLYDIYDEQKRTIISQDQIPNFIKWATISAEDDSFYTNFGIDVKGIIRAMFKNIQSGGMQLQGGSTITQQFVKNAFLTREQTIPRKIKELILTLEIEWRYPKDQILTWYLNQIPYGSNTYGIEAASEFYFNKHAQDLTIAESALLAAIPRAPTYYSPHGNHPDELIARQQYILDRMRKFDYITQEDYDNALKEKLTFQKNQGGFKAPHFVLYVKEQLETIYGPNYLQSSGLVVRTTLDWDLQKKAEEIIKEEALKNLKNKGQNAALVTIDPKTGQILTMVGSRDYFADPSPAGCISGKNCAFDPNVNVAIRPRQPGSSFKPFAYSEAFNKGYTPDTIIFDIPTEFNAYCAPDGSQDKDQYGLKCYHPQNYTGTFRGPVTMKEALAQSINIPAIKTLYLAGVSETISLAKKMGITSLRDPSRYGLSLVLGGGEVTLLEETSAYGVFATSGSYMPTTSIISITDTEGNVVQKHNETPQLVLDKSVTDLISGILSSDDLRAPVFGRHGNLYTPNISTAVKTGTTQNYRDAWTVGYTPDIVVGVWVGNNDGTFMTQGGVNAAAPIWNKIITYIYNRPKSNSDFIVSRASTLPVLSPSQTGNLILDGNIAGLETVDGVFHTILYFLDKDNPRGQGNSQGDAQFSQWEAAISNWIKTNPILIPPPPTAPQPNNPTQPIPPISIDLLSPTQYQLQKNSQNIAEIILISTTPISTLRITQDDRIILVKDLSDQNTLSFTADIYLNKPIKDSKTSTVRIEVGNKSGESLSKSFPFISN